MREIHGFQLFAMVSKCLFSIPWGTATWLWCFNENLQMGRNGGLHPDCKAAIAATSSHGITISSSWVLLLLATTQYTLTDFGLHHSKKEKRTNGLILPLQCAADEGKVSAFFMIAFLEGDQLGRRKQWHQQSVHIIRLGSWNPSRYWICRYRHIDQWG